MTAEAPVAEMTSHLFRYVLRPTVLVASVTLAMLACRSLDPVPFQLLVAALVPSCLLAVLLIRRTTQHKADVERMARVQSEGKLEAIVRENRELTRELLESRMLDEAQDLQVRAFDAFLQGVTITDPNRPGNPIVYANEGFTRLTGYSKFEAIGRNCRFLQGPETSQATIQVIRDAIRQQRPCFVEIQNYRKDGTAFWNALSIAPIFEDGQLTHFVGVQTDITAFKQMELQLRQSQKMEAIGHLAGGVAHDFNNLLTVINGCCELIRSGSELPDDALPLVDEVHKAGERAATLTRQLLAFSRKTVLQPRVLSLNELVTDIQKMLARLIGEDVALTTALRSHQPLVRVDPGQLEQVLMNLVVNSRDAMPQGGRLAIETQDVTFDSEYAARNPDVRAGRYVRLSVTDTGSGMDAKTKARIFEPFFTTKAVGKGTGLGLATVYGIVQQSGGHLTVESELGRGTTFRLFFPTVAEPARGASSIGGSVFPGGTETILIVEDEVGVRTLASQALEAHGYRVLTAADGDEALVMCRLNEIELVLCDVVMPGMCGRELQEELVELCPDTRLIFMSGYTDDAILRHGVAQADCDFIQKPFTISGLLRKVREVLDRAPSRTDELMACGY